MRDATSYPKWRQRKRLAERSKQTTKDSEKTGGRIDIYFLQQEREIKKYEKLEKNCYENYVNFKINLKYWPRISVCKRARKRGYI